MQRNPSEPRRDPRHGAERDGAQPMGGQPRAEDDEDALEEPERVPSFLTARELQARNPAKPGERGVTERKPDAMPRKDGDPQ